MKLTVTLTLVLMTFAVFAQYPEYRITDDGQYQFLANKGLPGSVLDETGGTVYKPITIRTFFLEVQNKGYLPEGTTYEKFYALSIEEQRDIVKQPFAKPLDCSIGESLSQACLVYRGSNNAVKSQKSQAGQSNNDSNVSTTSVVRVPIQRQPREQVETVKLILHVQ